MISLPPNPAPWKPVLDWATEAQKTLRALRPVAGLGIRITESTNNVIISAVSESPSAVVPAAPFAFEIYRSPFTGEGEAPADQARRIKVRPGTVNNKLHSSYNTEFVVPANSDWEHGGAYLLWVKVSLSHSGGYGTVTAVVVEGGTEVPADDAGPTPANVYYQIGYVTSNADAITAMVNLVKTTLSGNMQVTYWTCSTQVRQWVWNLLSSEY